MPLAFLAALAARFLTAGVLQWLALKLVLFTLLVVVLPIVLNNFLHGLMQTSMTLLSSTAAEHGIGAPLIVQLTGLAGYFAGSLKVPEVVALLAGALAFRVALRFIPFVGK